MLLACVCIVEGDGEDTYTYKQMDLDGKGQVEMINLPVKYSMYLCSFKTILLLMGHPSCSLLHGLQPATLLR